MWYCRTSASWVLPPRKSTLSLRGAPPFLKFGSLSRLTGCLEGLVVQSATLVGCGVQLQGIEPPKAFEIAVSFAQTLTQWSFLVIAGSILTLVGTSYRRPLGLRVRLGYLLFLPGWYFLFRSILDGISVQGIYLAYLLTRPDATKLKEFFAEINTHVFRQVQHLKCGLAFFALWLFLFLIWWISSKQPVQQAGA